jgi:hypothetical protein
METDAIGKQYVGMDSSMLMEMAHSKHHSEKQKTAAVSQQFESVLVKQFLKEALKPMFKGVFNEDGNAHRMYRHFFYGRHFRKHSQWWWFRYIYPFAATTRSTRKSFLGQ